MSIDRTNGRSKRVIQATISLYLQGCVLEGNRGHRGCLVVVGQTMGKEKDVNCSHIRYKQDELFFRVQLLTPLLPTRTPPASPALTRPHRHQHGGRQTTDPHVLRARIVHSGIDLERRMVDALERGRLCRKCKKESDDGDIHRGRDDPEVARAHAPDELRRWRIRVVGIVGDLKHDDADIVFLDVVAFE